MSNATPEQQQQMQQMLASILDPSVIGDMVLHAIQNDVFYILSHGDFRERLTARGQEIAESFDLWSAWREEHGV